VASYEQNDSLNKTSYLSPKIKKRYVSNLQWPCAGSLGNLISKTKLLCSV